MTDPGPNSDSKEIRERRYSWTQPQCWICYQRANPDRKPTQLAQSMRETERCVTCGIWNRDGIYIRIDPVSAPYPSILKDPLPMGEMKEDF